MAGKEVPTAWERSHLDRDAPDLVGEELGDNARIWNEYERVARDDDTERIGTWNRGLDNLALFAGLLSAVTTTFIVESQHAAEPDYARLTFLVLNATASGVPFAQETFTIEASVRLINCLWVASLMLSLTAALIAIMGKDWIGMYASRPVCNPRQWAEIRTYRLACVNRWYMSGVIASAPVLLHMSLILFCAGLVLFVSPDPVLQRVALWLALAAGTLYLITMLSAVIFPASPFKSPATQAFRESARALFSSSRELLADGIARHPIALLQQATLILGTLLSHPLPATIIPLDRAERRGLRMGDVRIFWNRLFATQSVQSRSWSETARLAAVAARSSSIGFVCSFPTRLRAALDEYRYLRQRPRTRPWRYSVRLYLGQLDLSDRWSEVRTQPTPGLLAESLSLLNVMSHSPGVFRSILVALGDLAIGGSVAPLVSSDLKARVTTEIRHKWLRAELGIFSRYILAEQNISRGRLPTASDNKAQRFSWSGELPMRSESILFALIRLYAQGGIAPVTIYAYCPDSTVQPRALRYLLPLLPGRDIDVRIVVFLADRYWQHLKDDSSFNLEAEMRRRQRSPAAQSRWSKSAATFGGRSGLVELLVSLILDAWVLESAVAASNLIRKVISEVELGSIQHPCLVYLLGSDQQRVATCAWAARPTFDTGLSYLEKALPLRQYRHFVQGRTTSHPVLENRSGFEICLARTIVRLLSPSQPWSNVGQSDTVVSPSVTTLELCISCLHSQLCGDRSILEEEAKGEIVRLVLENSVLIRIGAFREREHLRRSDSIREHDILLILAAISHHLARLMEQADTFPEGRFLFCLFTYAEAHDEKGQSVTWSLGSYLRDVSVRPSHQDQAAKVSMRRLISAINTLRPYCATRDDLRVFWDSIGLPPDSEQGYLARELLPASIFPREERLALANDVPQSSEQQERADTAAT